MKFTRLLRNIALCLQPATLRKSRATLGCFVLKMMLSPMPIAIYALLCESVSATRSLVNGPLVDVHIEHTCNNTFDKIVEKERQVLS